MKRGLAVAVVVSALLLPGAAQARAQDDPAAAQYVTPRPADCRVEPRSRASLVALLVGDGPTERPPVAPGLVRFDPGAGEPADAETVDAVRTTVLELYACANAGDLPRLYALYTDDYLRRALGRDALTEELLARYGAAPKPRPAAERDGVALGTVRVQPDGQVGAYVEVLSGVEPYTDFVLLVEEEGRYRVDEILPLMFRPEAAD